MVEMFMSALTISFWLALVLTFYLIFINLLSYIILHYDVIWNTVKTTAITVVRKVKTFVTNLMHHAHVETEKATTV